MERFSTDKHRSVTPEMVVEVLGRHGQEISLTRAAAILELLYELSWHSVALEVGIATQQKQRRLEEIAGLEPKNTSNENCRPISKGKHKQRGR